MKNLLRRFITEERGEFGIKQIALTVAAIVIIGVVVTIISTNADSWVSEIWTMFIDFIKDTFGVT